MMKDIIMRKTVLILRRLHKKYQRLMAAGKDQRKIVTAVGRELLGFIWAIGRATETRCRQQSAMTA
jgi:hypothetical protein